MKYTYSDLISRLTNLERLAEPPAPGEKGGCQSSYDRRSRYENRQYLDWDANNDADGFIRRESSPDGTAYIVAFEAKGPGCIWRAWSALPQAGHIQIFIDDELAVDMPFRDFFERWPGEVFPMNLPNLAFTISRGRNRWIPLPWNRSCKILLAEGWGAYYHLTYTTFPDGTNLPAFSETVNEEARRALAEADRKLYHRGPGFSSPSSSEDIPSPAAGTARLSSSSASSFEEIESVLTPKSSAASDVGFERSASNMGNSGPSASRHAYTSFLAQEMTEHMKIDLQPNNPKNVLTLHGRRAITYLEFTLDQVKPDALSRIFMHITWDDEVEPAVWAPLSLFFATTSSTSTPYRTLPMGLLPGSKLYCRFFMPFERCASIALSSTYEQDSDIKTSLKLEVRHQALPLEKQYLQFHAKAHGDLHNWKAIEEGRSIDWPILMANDDPGSGRFIGMNLAVYNTTSGIGDPEEDWWWGEGDEKFFVDEETFPSTFGTGSEDYIGYAWAAVPPFPLFESLYAAQTHIEVSEHSERTEGLTMVSRFHVADDVPWHEGFEAYIEKYHGNEWGKEGKGVCRYECVAFWYQEGVEDEYPVEACQASLELDQA